jgi:uncharacterized membrane protein
MSSSSNGSAAPRALALMPVVGLLALAAGIGIVSRRRRLPRVSACVTGEDAKPIQVSAAITVRRDPQELYGIWRDFERFPDFMAHLEDVRSTGPTRSHWKAKAPLGLSAEWDAEITEDVAGERIAWRSLEGSKVASSGVVRFKPAPGDRGTEVHVELRYDPPGGALGMTLAKLMGEEPAIQIKDDLRRFKQIVETGEVVRSDGTPEGTRGLRMVKQRPAVPAGATP